MPLTHHELCFGCGQANLFGLHLDLDRVEGEALAGRFFLKQDHQGPDGAAHPGIIGAALEEAISHLLDPPPGGAGGEGPPVAGAHETGASRRLEIERVQIEYRGRAPVGTYVEIRAWLEPGPEAGSDARARAARAQALGGEPEHPLAEASAVLLVAPPVGE